MILQRYEINNHKIILSKESVDNSRPDGQKIKQYKIKIMRNGKAVKATYYSKKRDMEATSRLLVKVFQDMNYENECI